MSTRHLLIRTEAGLVVRLLGRCFLSLRLYLGVFGVRGDWFSLWDLLPTGVVGAALSFVFSISIIPTVMVGTVVGAVCMGSAGFSIVCRMGKGPVY